MPSTVATDRIQTLRVEKEIIIGAPLDIAFESLLEEIGPANELPGGAPMPMVLEPWPGGRWFRDLGNRSGHLWGHVQVIKPPVLLEITGSMFMSYAAINHVQYRLIVEGIGTKLRLVHQAFGDIPAEHREGVVEGWTYGLNRIRQIAETRVNSK